MRVTRAWSVSTVLLVMCLVLSSFAALAQTAAVRPRVTQAVDMRNLVTLKGNVHPLARAEFDQGVAPDDLPMNRMLLVLQRGADQEASLRQMLDEQQVKSSEKFHQWLTPEQFGQQFGPADSDVQAVTNWLSSQGFQVAKVAAGRTIVEFSGTAGLVRQVLGTEVHKFRVAGVDHWANARDPQIPAALAPLVRGIDALNNFPNRPLHESRGTFSRSKLTGEVKPLFTFPGSGGFFIAVGPTDFATIYNIAPLWSAGTTGAGQTIAVVGQTNIDPQDVADFRSMFGLPANAPHIIVNGPDPGINGDETEADLDVEWSGAVAKGATIDFVIAESTETTPGIDLSALYIVDNNLAPVMSISYGGCEAQGDGSNAFHRTLWEQAAAQGITVVIASGDSGSGGCDYSQAGEFAAIRGLGVSGLAATPFNVSVGGTDFNDLANAQNYWNLNNSSPGQNSAVSYIPEMTWNDSCAGPGVLSGCASPDPSLYNFGVDLAAGGGGPSTCMNPTGLYPAITCTGGGYPKPSWQSGTGVPSDGVRDTPDVSMFAGDGFNASFYVICERDANAAGGGSSSSCDLNSPYMDFQGVGGTSASAQVFAGVMALVNQAHGRQGNANYVFYPLAAQAGNSCTSNAAAVSNSACIFYDINNSSGDLAVNSGNSVICLGGTPKCSNTNGGANQFGILSSGSPLAPAYSTTAGYDYATGLGSPNVANLVNHWASNFTPTTVTLALSTTPPTAPVAQVHGQAVNFTVTVSSGSGTPTGDVSLIAQAGTGTNNVTAVGPFTLSSGTATGSTIMLPGGSYSVTAHYAGNGTFAAMDSTPGIPVTISKEASKTALRLVALSDPPVYNLTTVPYGSPYFLRLDVTNGGGQLCAPAAGNGEQIGPVYTCPTGSLTVAPAPTDVDAPAGTVPGQYKLNAQGYAEDQPVQQPAGVYSFVATYAGDINYNTSNSTTPITITKAVTATSITGVPPSGLVGTQISVTATVTTDSNGAAPTGTIQLLNNGTPLGSPVAAFGTAATTTTAATAQATIPVNLAVAITSISATYSGDANYATSTSGATAIAVSDYSLSANPSPLTITPAGQTGTTTVKVTPANGFTGNVTLSIASGCPTNATCNFASSSVNVTSATPVTDVLTIVTTGSALTPPASRWILPPSHRLPVGLLGIMAGLLALGILLTSSATRRRPALLLSATLLLVLGAWAACGGGGGGGGGYTPPPAPTVSLSSTGLTFSSQNVGTTSAAQGVTLTNSGNGTLNINSITLTGANSGDFSETTTCNSTLAASANCSISAKFAPTAGGTRNASISISDNATGTPHVIALTGTGASQPTPTGTYPLVVNAVSGNDTHTLTVNVTVQ